MKKKYIYLFILFLNFIVTLSLTLHIFLLHDRASKDASIEKNFSIAASVVYSLTFMIEFYIIYYELKKD